MCKNRPQLRNDEHEILNAITGQNWNESNSVSTMNANLDFAEMINYNPATFKDLAIVHSSREAQRMSKPDGPSAIAVMLADSCPGLSRSVPAVQRTSPLFMISVRGKS